MSNMERIICLWGNDEFSAWFYSNNAAQLMDKEERLADLLRRTESVMSNRNTSMAAAA